MRLFNVHTLQLVSFFGKELPRYAILSHRWGPDDEELTFRDVQAKNLNKPGIGAVKLRGCIDQAKNDNIGYIWVDTFCINKADDATELTKAINSMFAWYQAAAVCYVYLCDVHNSEGPLDEWPRLFGASQWFRRGWTLQELLAPSRVRFFDRKWLPLGTKRSMSAEIEKATGISAGFLEGVWPLEDASIAQRMSWAAGRITKEPEDVAYSLLGIFGVNMPLIYGEGANAFIRLQEEIAKRLSDDSILAWGLSPSTPVEELGAASPGSSRGVLASSPADFVGSGNIVFNRDAPPMHWSSGSGSLGIEMALCMNKLGQIHGLLHCHAADDSGNVVGIPLERLSAQRSNEYVRPAGRLAKLLPLAKLQKRGKGPAALIRIRVSPLADRNKDQDGSNRFWVKGLTSVGLEVAETFPDGCWNARNSTVVAPIDDTARQHIWLRLRKKSDNEDTFDFILLLSNELTTQRGPRPPRKAGLAVCSRTARLPKKIYGGAPSLDFWQSDSRAPACMHLTLRQSEQFIGAKSTYVIDLGVADTQCPCYMDLTGDFSRIELQANIVDSLNEYDKLLQGRIHRNAQSQSHDKHIAALDSSIETLDSAIARLQGLRNSLGSERELVKQVQMHECRDLYDYDDSGSNPLSQYDRVVDEALKMMESSGKGEGEADGSSQAADAVFELIIGHISDGVDLKRPAGWTPCEIATYYAACHGQHGPLDFLKKMGADLEVALLRCAREGSLKGVKTLFQAGASLDGPEHCDDPPFILAIDSGNRDLVEMMLSHEVSMNVEAFEGHTPEEVAAMLERDDIREILHMHRLQRQDEAGAQEKVEKALDQICWSLSTRKDVKQMFDMALFDYENPELRDCWNEYH